MSVVMAITDDAEPVFPLYICTVPVSNGRGVVSVQFGPVICTRHLQYCNKLTVFVHGKVRIHRRPNSGGYLCVTKVIFYYNILSRMPHNGQ